MERVITQKTVLRIAAAMIVPALLIAGGVGAATHSPVKKKTAKKDPAAATCTVTPKNSTKSVKAVSVSTGDTVTCLVTQSRKGILKLHGYAHAGIQTKKNNWLAQDVPMPTITNPKADSNVWTASMVVPPKLCISTDWGDGAGPFKLGFSIYFQWSQGPETNIVDGTSGPDLKVATGIVCKIPPKPTTTEPYVHHPLTTVTLP